VSVPSSPDLALFKNASLFKGIDAARLAQVAQSAHRMQVEADEYLFMQEDSAGQFYLVLGGKLKLSQVTVDGQQVIMGYATPGQVVAVIAVLALETYPTSAQAVETTTLLAWNRVQARQLMLDIPELALNAMQILAAHVVEYQNRLREMATERVERRVARTLLRLARQTGRKTEAGVLIDMPLTRQDLAELTGTTLYTVSRTLSQWESQGLVRSKREQITILKPHGLVSIAEDL